ncbi:DUF2945 domain-containing protein [Frigidibacter sp. MR17.24]|uniref:DUF2945 domain-containing protein n=1 Tax=Frigidibacter sp. MR17.24 TaxID=3127345 RepID=UPI003012D9BB
MSRFSKGDTVAWSWGRGEGKGEVAEVFTRRVKRRIKGREITRNGSRARPAYLIRQDDGDRVLKLDSELSRP